MFEPLISREQIRARARAAFRRGDSRDSHEMNWHSPALATWLNEYDNQATLSLCNPSPQITHSAKARFDAAQTGMP